MDDDAPLSALAKPMKLDDDTPLASLADFSKPKATPKTAKTASSPAAKGPKGSPNASAGKAAGKATPKRKAGKGSSSSSSSSSGSSSESESDPKPKAPRRKGSNTSVGKKAKLRLLDKKVEEGDDDGPNDGGGAVKKRDRQPKEQVVADLLCRWWYVMPEWPPRDEAYYQAELEKRSLRKVSVQEWEWVPEEDKQGRKKVYELSAFPGLFRASNGDLIDCRPRETCPCYQNFMKKDLPDLYDLLVTAFENQIKDLANSKYNETQLEQELKARLTSVRDKAYGAKQMTAAKRRKSG
uniref:Uncharacterized protein n=1 Tax=Alexandrium catenella TaxID=2925 RepID=A0A7S1RPG0_ALECA